MKQSQGLWAVIAVVLAAGIGVYIWMSGQGTTSQEVTEVVQTAPTNLEPVTTPILKAEEAAPVAPVQEELAEPEAPVEADIQDIDASKRRYDQSTPREYKAQNRRLSLP